MTTVVDDINERTRRNQRFDPQSKECALPEQEWTTFDTEPDGTMRQWAEVVYVPSKKSEHKHTQPLRYVGLRLLKAQGVLFADGSDRHHHAVVTNLDWGAVRLLQWHREKAGTVEHVHDELKNGLAAGHMSSQRFAVNAAWLKLAIPSYNIASAIKGLCFSPEGRTARFKKYRLLLVHVAGRMNRNNCVMRLRLCASAADHRAHRGSMEGVPVAHPSFAHQALAACGLADSAPPTVLYNLFTATPASPKAALRAEHRRSGCVARSESPAASF